MMGISSLIEEFDLYGISIDFLVNDLVALFLCSAKAESLKTDINFVI